MSFALFLWVGTIYPFHVSENPFGIAISKMTTADYLIQAFGARHETCAPMNDIPTYECTTYGMLFPSEIIAIYEYAR